MTIAKALSLLLLAPLGAGMIPLTAAESRPRPPTLSFRALDDAELGSLLRNAYVQPIRDPESLQTRNAEFFNDNGEYERLYDRVRLHGKYRIINGEFCVEISDARSGCRSVFYLAPNIYLFRKKDGKTYEVMFVKKL